MHGLGQDVLSMAQLQHASVSLAVLLAIMTSIMTYVRPAVPLSARRWAHIASVCPLYDHSHISLPPRVAPIWRVEVPLAIQVKQFADSVLGRTSKDCGGRA